MSVDENPAFRALAKGAALTAQEAAAYSKAMPWNTPLSQRSLGGRVLIAILVLALGVALVLTQYPVVPNRALATFVVVAFVIYGLLAVFRPRWLESWDKRWNTKIQKVFNNWRSRLYSK